jgi:DNA-binding transcriptional regulator/RsmH inhibitor MraZ
MKKITLAILIVFVTSFNLFAQNLPVFDVKYSIIINDDNPGLDNTNPYMQVYTNEDYALIKAELMIGTYDYLIKKSEDSLYTLINHEDKNYLQVTNTYGVLDFFEIDLSSNKTKTIQGYLCRLATVKYTGNEEGEEDLGMEIWYSTDIPYFDLTSFAFLKKIPGIALEMSTEYFTIEAFEINKTTLPQSAFEIPEEYTEMEVDAAVEHNSLGEDRFYYEDESGEYFGIKDADGNIISPATKFISLSHFNEGVAIVTDIDGKYGSIDINGKEIMPLKYDYLYYESSENQYLFIEKDKYGLIKDGEIIIPAEYDYLTFFSNGYATFLIGNNYGLIDKNNKIIVPAKYNNISENSSELFVVQDEKGKFNMYSISDKKILASKYDLIALGQDSDLILVQKNDKYGYINKEGKIVLPIQYTYATVFTDGFAIVAFRDDLDDAHHIDTSGKKIDQIDY